MLNEGEEKKSDEYWTKKVLKLGEKYEKLIGTNNNNNQYFQGILYLLAKAKFLDPLKEEEEKIMAIKYMSNLKIMSYTIYLILSLLLVKFIVKPIASKVLTGGNGEGNGDDKNNEIEDFLKDVKKLEQEMDNEIYKLLPNHVKSLKYVYIMIFLAYVLKSIDDIKKNKK